MPRLFTGLEIPPEIAATLRQFQGGLRGARWIEPSDLHITLRFLGDVDGTVAEDVNAALQAADMRCSLTVTLDALASFGGDKPRAIIATVRPDPPLTELQAAHERIAREAGAAPERRKFTPHVTLGRLRREVQAADVAEYLAESGLFASLRFPVSRVALFSARDSTGGGPYVVEAAYPLT